MSKSGSWQSMADAIRYGALNVMFGSTNQTRNGIVLKTSQLLPTSSLTYLDQAKGN